MKLVLLLLGVSGLALLGAGAAKNGEPVKIFSADLVPKSFAAIGAREDQPAQVVGESSRGTMPAQDVPAATPVEPNAPPSAPAIAEGPKTASTALAVPAAGQFSIGDRLKIAFYERVDVEEDKWGRTSSALRGIQQRPELSGEYTVQDDGTISVPLLGAVPVTSRSAQQVQAALLETFEQLLGRKALVNILSLERSPIYVLGPVKNAGSFKYAPGMTVLHAIALAGGLDSGAREPWQKIEAVREIHKRTGAVDSMLKLMARSAVLKAERDKSEARIPSQLLDLIGATEATSLVNEQRNRRKAIAMARKNRESAILSALDSAKQDLVVYGRMDSLDELIKLRQERVNSMRTLVDRNVISKTVLSQVQGELSDAEQRRQDANNQYANAKQRLASLESEALRVQADLRNDLEVEIEAIDREIAANEREFNTSEGILSALPATRAEFAKEANRITYQVVRQTAAGPVSIESSGMTLLQPGDLVNVIVGESDSKGQPSSLTPTSPPDQRRPAGRTANRQESSRAVAD
jgi:protein involved in polysaccharide export with SLBB domain